MNVTLVRPPVLMPTLNMATLVVPPLGLAYVAAALRQAGHQLSVVAAVGEGLERFTGHPQGRLHGLGLDEVVERIPDGSHCIGVSAQFSFEWPIVRALIEKIRARFPAALLMAGGEHATALPEQSLRESPLDLVVLGEGERTTPIVLDTVEHNGRAALDDVAGICYHAADGTSRATRPAERITDLGSIPRPAWDLVPFEEYLRRGHGFGVRRGRSAPVLASRGCPYRCSFCSSPSMWTTRWRARDPEDVLDEIEDLQRTYRIDNVDFYDLTMIVRRRWIVDFCRAIERRQLRFVWQLPSGTRSEAIDREVSDLLYRTGCRNLSYAPESGSARTLDAIQKKVSWPRMMRSLGGALDRGLNVKLNFIIGFPDERWGDLLWTWLRILQAATRGAHDVSIWVFAPYPGSALYAELRASGRISRLGACREKEAAGDRQTGAAM